SAAQFGDSYCDKVAKPLFSWRCIPDAQRLRSLRAGAALPSYVHLYSAAFLQGGRARNELLAVAGASHAFVVGSKSLNQCACRTRREETAANWRNYQASNQRVGIGDRLCNIR